MAARPSFQQRFAQQQAAAEDQGDEGQTGGEEMASEAAESQPDTREVRHVKQAALHLQSSASASTLRGGYITVLF